MRAVWGVMLVVWLAFGANASAQVPDKDHHFNARIKIAIFGDGLVSDYGLTQEQALPTMLRRFLYLPQYRLKDVDIQMINAARQGDTSTAGLARVQQLIQLRPDIAIIIFGANDVHKNLAPQITSNALEQMIATLKSNGVFVMLVGMRAPKTADVVYREEFGRIYPILAGEKQVALYPNFYEGLSDPRLHLQADGLHISPEGIEIIAHRMSAPVAKMVDKLVKYRIQKADEEWERKRRQ